MLDLSLGSSSKTAKPDVVGAATLVVLTASGFLKAENADGLWKVVPVPSAGLGGRTTDMAAGRVCRLRDTEGDCVADASRGCVADCGAGCERDVADVRATESSAFRVTEAAGGLESDAAAE